MNKLFKLLKSEYGFVRVIADYNYWYYGDSRIIKKNSILKLVDKDCNYNNHSIEFTFADESGTLYKNISLDFIEVLPYGKLTESLYIEE
jgi:hypothetical protein